LAALFLGVLTLPPGIDAQGKVAPLLPEEYAANCVQMKWNHNGFDVNNTYSLVTFSSFSRQMLRTDGCLYGTTTNNASNPMPTFIGRSQISLLDFSQGLPPKNTYIGWSTLVEQPQCAIAPGAWIPPMASTFLSDVGAVYAGTDELPFIGWTQKWMFQVAEFNLTATFYFDSHDSFVRYDFITEGSAQGEVGVVTYLFNMRQNILNDDIFVGSGSCPSWANTTVVGDEFATAFALSGNAPFSFFAGEDDGKIAFDITEELYRLVYQSGAKHHRF